jgi:hypothetical protein
MLPWTFDADNIDIGDITLDNIYQLAVVRTPQVESFLRFGAEDRKYFVVAPKGLGKTFLLKVKSKFYRETVSGYKRHCIPSGDELVEKLTSIRVSFSKEELGRFKSIETWEKTWELCLLTLILRNFNIELPSDLKKIIGEARTLLDILSAFIKSRNLIDKLYSEYVSTFLRPKLGDLHKEGINQIAIFIDNIDEGIEQHGYYRKNTPGTWSEEVWVNAQLGMMKIVRDICTRYKHIKIFVSIRSEAFNNLGSQTSLQYQDISSVLSYSKAQIREIFEQNISITRRGRLARPDAVNLMERFVGFSTLEHRFVKDDGEPRKEDTFDFIYRHTFGRPREIVLMGSKIEEIPVSERTRDAERVREVVNDVSGYYLLEQLKKEIIPYFQDEVFDKFCDLVGSNVISIQQAEKITNEISESFQFKDVFSYLYSIGLVGITEYSWRRRQYVQRFLPVGKYSLSANIPPAASKYFAIHSAVDKTLRDKHGRDFYNESNIIGDGLVFQGPTSSIIDNTSKVLHTHFGLGRDSLTLIIPELNKSKRLAVIQKPSREERELAQAQFVEIRTGNYDAIKFRIVNDTLTPEQINEAIAQWEESENIIVYSSRPEIIGRIIHQSETISLWSSNLLGDAHEEDILPATSLEELTSDTKKKTVYLCQRVINKKILKAIREQIKSRNLDDKVFVEMALIDRLEYETSKYQVNHTVIYDVKAEEFGSIICRERDDSRNQSDDVIRRTKSAAEQTYYEDRGKYLKEGIYRLTKIIKRGDEEVGNLDNIYNLFFDIQIAKLASKHKLYKIYPRKSETEIMQYLKGYCKKHKDRFDKLQKIPGFVRSRTKYIQDAKRMGAFPDKNFFQLARQSPFFAKSQVVLDLAKLLNIEPLKNYYSVFVCFSARDGVFAKKLSDSLKKRGVDIYFFKDRYRSGEIKSVERQEIGQRDKILVILSENSITSDECQQELTLGIEKKQGRLGNLTNKETVKDIFIPIKTDNYLWDVSESMLVSRLRNDRQGWDNVQIIRRQAISDFSEFRNEQVTSEFEERVDTDIMPALYKKR